MGNLKAEGNFTSVTVYRAAFKYSLIYRDYPQRKGSHWFECSLLPYVIFCFFGFPLGTRLTYCVVGGGCGVFSQ